MQNVPFIILAGGSGKRFKSARPKQYIRFNNYNFIENIIEGILPLNEIHEIVIVHQKKYRNEIIKIKKKYKEKKIISAIAGKTRQESSLEGLKKIKALKSNKVLIHDACRPFIDIKEIRRIIYNLKYYDGCVPIIKNNDLVRVKRGNNLLELSNESYLTQTPQGFKFNKIYNMHLRYPFNNSRDDIEIINNIDNKIKYIDGRKNNIKITFKKDIDIFNFFKIKQKKYGIGYDIHKIDFKSKKKLKLCGVKINHQPLIAHSDGDVGYHSLCDSIFGALSIGDIGKFFNNKNKKWKNKDSKYFLKFAKQKIDEKKAKIINIDMNFICEKPKISKYCNLMKLNITKILKIKKSIINIKATTNEKISLIGKGKAIAAESIISIEV